ncbi:MAG: phosphoribosyltransferase [Thaumarchaeota archaeon]|nr:phosphoribosyltransferase [Nitrososphaerota archaeon]
MQFPFHDKFDKLLVFKHNMKFKNRNDAGLQLAIRLSWLKGEKTIILAIPRGGVVVADVIAKSLNTILDVVVPRKLGTPYNPELAIGAVMHDNSSYINEYVINALRIEPDFIRAETKLQLKEIQRRLIIFRGNSDYDLKDKVVILVDDGVATGATMISAILWIKKQKPKLIILAIPVAPNEIIRKLNEMVDRTVVLYTPKEFSAVGEFYEDFTQINDEEVVNMIKKYKL